MSSRPDVSTARPPLRGSGRANPRRARTVSRTIHLIAALAIGTFIYAPAEYVEPFRLLLQVLVIPLTALTGVYLWRQAAIRRGLARLRRTGP